ncbi:MAG: DUF1329 domain-containing protein [Desulfobacterales bacterium]|nr:DUF1329 domain-containing protein [Desulfobacterales bacterium]
MKKKVAIICITLLICLVGISFAKVSQEEAAKLGNELTPVGGEKAGNADGTIPEWTGGITTPPAGYKVGDHHPDPFPDDKPLFTITAQNYEQYKDKLSDGLIAMFKTYPDTFKMIVYQTRRTGSYPQYVYDAIKTNAINAELTDDGNGVVNANIASAFPIPKNGIEAIWNHIIRYRAGTVAKYGAQAAPNRDGSYTIMEMKEEILMFYSMPEVSTQDKDDKNLYAYFKQEILSPPRLAGTMLLIHETMNQIRKPRQAWTYNTGQKRVRRAPNIAYDTPGTASDGLRTTDDWDLYNGSPDRYNWTLVGKKEMYIPYNSYKLHSDKLKYSDILKAGHINQDLPRYELHRVWVVKGELKDGMRHLYKTRVFYLDEDSWQAALEDCYDNRDQLWRVASAHILNYYEIPVVWSTLDVLYDLQAGRYLAVGLDNEGKMYDFNVKLSAEDFSPSALRQSGVR